MEFEYENKRGITEMLNVSFHINNNSVVIDEIINKDGEYLELEEIPKIRLNKIISKCKYEYDPMYNDYFKD